MSWCLLAATQIPRAFTRRCGVWFGCFLLFFAAGCGPTSSRGSTAGKEERFIVPDGTPEQILAFVEEVQNRNPKFSKREQMIAHMTKVQRAMIDASDKILAQKADDETLRKAASMKLAGMVGAAMAGGLTPAQTEVAIKSATDADDRLRMDPRPVVAAIGNDFVFSVRALRMWTMTPEQRKQLLDDAIQYLTNSKLSQTAVGNAEFVVDQYVRFGELRCAVELCEALAKLLEASPDKENREWAATFQMKANRFGLALPERGLEIDGHQLDGSEFDWKSYRGKVVLIDFWATWCQPCVAELPNVEAHYREFHSKGFEVVGISLDHSRLKLEQFLEHHPLPWAQLYPETDIPEDETHPMAKKYGVDQIPFTLLVDREGKVAAVDPKGPKLTEELRKVLNIANGKHEHHHDHHGAKHEHHSEK